MMHKVEWYDTTTLFRTTLVYRYCTHIYMYMYVNTCGATKQVTGVVVIICILNTFTPGLLGAILCVFSYPSPGI